jgi:excisionase family DNA binding protein
MQNQLEKRVLTFSEACDFTGLSKSYLYKLTASRQVPHFKPNGKMIYFDVKELEAWLLSNPIKTADQINRESDAYLIKKGAGI